MHHWPWAGPTKPGPPKMAAFWLLQVAHTISDKFGFTNQSSMPKLARKHPMLVKNGCAHGARHPWLKIGPTKPGPPKLAAFGLLQVTHTISDKFDYTNQSSMSNLVRNHSNFVENGHAWEAEHQQLEIGPTKPGPPKWLVWCGVVARWNHKFLPIHGSIKILCTLISLTLP